MNRRAPAREKPAPSVQAGTTIRRSDAHISADYSLALGEVGSWLFGLAALLWTLDCFVGAYLTFPPAQKRREGRPGKSWLRRWLPSWLLKTGQLFSAIFTLHRAAGLWLWAMLLVFAWTGVGFNLNPVFRPVMGAFGYRDGPEVPALPQPVPTPALDWRAAHAIGKKLMQAESERRGFTLGAEGLHMAQVGGLPYRIFVALLGLLVPALAVSGVWIWWRKRQPRRGLSRRRFSGREYGASQGGAAQCRRAE